MPKKQEERSNPPQSSQREAEKNLPVSKQQQGGITGAVLGGMVAGPVGAIAGGIAGAIVGDS